MKRLLLFSTILLLNWCAFAVTVPTPVIDSVQMMRDASGLQYFHIQFMDTIAAHTNLSIHIVRWRGSERDTTERTEVGVVSEIFGPIFSFDDTSYLFNPAQLDTNYTRSYSYAAYAEESLPDTVNDSVSYNFHSSALSPLVTGELDSSYIYFTEGSLNTIYARIGDTATITLQAKEYTKNETIRFVLHYAQGEATIDSITGKMQAVMSSNSTDFFMVKAIDNDGRASYCTIYLQPQMDSVAVVLYNSQTNNILPTNTPYYYNIELNGKADSLIGWSYVGGGRLNNSGSFTVVFPGAVNPAQLRVSAEGYTAAFVLDSTGNNADIDAGWRIFKVKLFPDVIHKITGRVTDAANNPVPNIIMEVYRADLYTSQTGDLYLPVDSAFTDTNGNYSISVASGDSSLQTDWATIAMVIDGPPTLTGAIFYTDTDVSNMNFQLPYVYGTANVLVNITSSPDYFIPIFIPTTIMLYSLIDSGIYNASTVSTDTGTVQVDVPTGNYFIFAQPQSGYRSGYYKNGAYAATWTEADTVVVTASAGAYVNLYLQSDTNIAMQGNGSHIDGIVNDPSNHPMGDTHLLLYQIISSPVGGTNQRLLYTTMTDVNGNYSFAKVPAGTYNILVDPIGRPLYELGNIAVSGADTTVKQNIIYTITGVSERPGDFPTQFYLAQNYPNPFSSFTNISFSLPMAEHATLKVYNALGEEVATLVNGEIAAGTHNIPFSAEWLQNGMYWYRLTAGGQMQTVTMNIVK